MHMARTSKTRNSLRSTLFLLSAFCLLLFSGCQTTTQALFTADGGNWHVRQGQALWQPRKGLPEFGGDLILACNDDGRCLIQFDKTPVSILSAQVTSNRWLIKFPQQNLSFSGHGSGPTRFTWLSLPRALAGETLPKKIHFQQKPDGGWRLENSGTGEKVEGFLSP
jgi:hypothetical protein